MSSIWPHKSRSMLLWMTRRSRVQPILGVLSMFCKQYDHAVPNVWCMPQERLCMVALNTYLCWKRTNLSPVLLMG